MPRLLQRLLAPYAPHVEGKDLGGDRGDTWPMPSIPDAGAKNTAADDDEDDDDDGDAETETDEEEATPEPAEAADDPDDAPADEEAPEDDEEEEDDGDPDDERKAKARGKGVKIPKARLDQEIRKRRELEKEVAELKKQGDAQKSREREAEVVTALESEIETLEEQFAAHMEAGETDKAAGVQKQLRGAERKLTDLNHQAMSDRSREVIKEELRVEAMIEAVTEKYPVLNPDAEEYDQETVDFVEAMRARYMGQGMRASVALRDAIDVVMKRAEAAKPQKGLAPAPDAAVRKGKAVERALEAKGRQPSKQIAGKDSDKLGGGFDPEKIATLSDAEYDKLPEDAIRKARGDYDS